MGEMRL